MIKAERVALSGDVVYEKVRIYGPGDPQAASLPKWFEDQQLVLHCIDGRLVIPAYRIALVHLTRSRSRLPQNTVRLVKRLALSGNLIYQPAWVLNPGMSKEVGVPMIFRPYSQFVFTTAEGLFVTSDFQVRGMVV